MVELTACRSDHRKYMYNTLILSSSNVMLWSSRANTAKNFKPKAATLTPKQQVQVEVQVQVQAP
jgi:hypothetical protein